MQNMSIRERKQPGMVADPWILKVRNQVSHNLKTAFSLDSSKSKPPKKQESKEHQIGILSFEVANVMSKTACLHKSLTDREISKLKNEILKCEGVVKLVSDDEFYLLELATAEKLDDLTRVAAVVARLGKKCTESALLGFEHIYNDIRSGKIDVKQLGFLIKDMDSMIRKMERYVIATSSLYNELEVLNELEQATKKFQQNNLEESRKAFEQKVIWQKQDVAHLKDVSLWNQTFDKIVDLLARTVCTIYARISLVFGDSIIRLEVSSSREEVYPLLLRERSKQFSGEVTGFPNHVAISGPLKLNSINSRSSVLEKIEMEKRPTNFRNEVNSERKENANLRNENFSFPCGSSPGRLFTDCLSLSSSASVKLDNCDETETQNGESSYFSASMGTRKESPYPSGCLNRLGTGFGRFNGGRRSQSVFKSKFMMSAPSSTVGGSVLALHYANVVIVIEKLLCYPHLVGEEARDDLYQMLPTSLRICLRSSLRSYVKSLAIYDAPLAHDWKEKLDKILKWLAPLAHNMVRWQTERNFEQQQIVNRTNVLLLQTLYFADRGKTEAAICELLVGLNYICRYEHQKTALLDCASSADFDTCMDWQLQYCN